MSSVNGVNCRNAQQVRAVADTIDCVPEEYRPGFAAALITSRLMVPKGRLMRFGVWMARKKNRAFPSLLAVFLKFPIAASEIVDGAAEWCLLGRDKSDPGSVCGWNNYELEQVVALLNAIIRVDMGSVKA